MIKLDLTTYVLKEGIVGCTHHEIITQRKDKHLIGVCQKCGMRKDYTLLHNQMKEMMDGYINPCTTMNMLMKSFRPKVKENWSIDGE